MKTGIILIIIVLILIGIFWFRNKSKVYEKAPNDFVMLESETESTDYLPIVDENWLKETELKYAGKEWESYPNECTDQGEKLCNDVYRPWKGEITHTEFLNKLTKEQRMYFALINFESQTNNGGVYQFLFNYPELSLITLQAMKVAKMEKLASDYENVLHEYFGKFETIQELNNKFQDDSKKWDKRWNSFAEGYKELESTFEIENYFYDKDYVKEFHSKMVEFVKEHRNGLMKTE
ncbi:DUF4375 domain-containing protein [Polaribacter haliotis]|uniref:DUF4375 domain-containing protein n=1 Tax=Polaribacter haliotis TaxID=1888915 RepID=A0A7L8AGH4_9FLAO|nr:DUF4375 domain-containing protein [Polaribacter haliotis]QOD61115.1 DUF4375 domain-containing protein [Polaribacter haliotis]